MHRPGRPNSAPPMVGILESATALFRTPEGSPVGPAIRRLRASIAILAGIVGLGVIGYWLIAGFNGFDALYQTILTVTTIGFAEIEPLDDDARAFTIVLAVLGVGAVVYLLTTVATLVLEGELKRDVEAWRMDRRIAELTHHYIICGAGRVGTAVAHAMADRQELFVLIDNDPTAIEALDGDWLSVQGDASSNDVLARAGVGAARGVVVATRSDAENTFITLSVKAFNPSLYVVARANEPESEPKLKQAGADRVVAPTRIAGRRMAVSVIHPAVAEFTETVLGGDETGEVLAQVDIQFDCDLDGNSIGEIFGPRSDIQVLGVRHGDSRVDIAPTPSVRLHAGDAVIVLGSSAAIDEISALASTRR